MAFDLLVFITWTTHDRARLIDADVAAELKRLLPVLASKSGASLVELAIVETHVHTVLSLGRAFDIAVLAQSLKGASCRLINQAVPRRRPLRWASGYDLHSVSRRSMPAVRRYFDQQGVHHHETLFVRWTAAAGTAYPADPRYHSAA
jgi:REP element-mobilizing transposase RayT